ncbi:MAG: enoyl-CoA hydratase-related protein [Planctomycetota bacterium]
MIDEPDVSSEEELSGPSGPEEPASEQEPAVIYTADPPAAIITMNRPERCNALNEDLLAGLHAALDLALDDDGVRAVILTGSGNSFCSGMDLYEALSRSDSSYEEKLADAERLARLFRRLRSFEKVTIAAVNGPALASGCGLATLCDFTLATSQATFGYPEVRFGFVPGVVSVYMRGMVNEKRLRDLVLTGRHLTADEACEIGLVSRVVHSDELMQQCLDIAAQIARNSPGSIRMTKELLETLPGLEIERALKAAVEYNARMRNTSECQEGTQSFLDKREPDWDQPEEPAGGGSEQEVDSGVEGESGESEGT